MRGAAAVILALAFSAILLAGIGYLGDSRRALLSSALEARENKGAFHTARNVEESFWQTLSATASHCGQTCSAEEAQVLTQGNFLRWKTFWESQGIEFSWANPAALSGVPVSSTPGTIIVSVVKIPTGTLYSFSVQGTGISGNVGNRTYAVIGAGEERACAVSSPENHCIWKVS